MRALALDIGSTRCGIAISDPDGRVASPVCVLPTRDVIQRAPSFKRLIQDWEPD
ncbi:MAG: Holliday junction resolvase RuvX, partial [Eggerthellaceae bacterium]|nr:Holliday junction resolvase RuvX [Eggerthellaceae bacterium]